MGSLASTTLLVFVSAFSFAQAIPPKPPDVPAQEKPFIGEYHANGALANILERSGKLYVSKEKTECALTPESAGEFQTSAGCALGKKISFEGHEGTIESLSMDRSSFDRAQLGDVAHSFHIAPVHPVGELRREALAAQPSAQPAGLRKPDLVELVKLDPTVHLDIRYAGTNNFMGTPFYTQARAFLQRPAAEAVVRANRKLHAYGYGVLIHDGYRPWYVTKMFWDATPNDKKDFVADPKKGSNHNRGCAVDLSLYNLRTGKEVEMPGGYDEMSDRSYPGYSGGTSLQRWRRDLLRAIMESEGFKVEKVEWWHFDYKDGDSYPVLNIPFEKIGD